jgi:predicted DNA-binding transcriptional regulator AlpA
MSKELLTTKDAAQLLSLRPDTLARWRWRGIGPEFVRVGGRAVRYPATALADWLRSQRAVSVPNISNRSEFSKE